VEAAGDAQRRRIGREGALGGHHLGGVEPLGEGGRGDGQGRDQDERSHGKSSAPHWRPWPGPCPVKLSQDFGCAAGRSGLCGKIRSGGVMDFLIIGVVAFLASGLTLYSGFGLGSVLLPAFALFFPAPVAVAATGVVHLLNGLFKGALLWRQADWIVVLRFGLPAVPAAVAGAWLLTGFGAGDQLFSWSVGGRVFGPAPGALVVGAVMVARGLLELQPWSKRLAAPPSAAPVGGLATGFLGGLTGQQGALRSMFLLRFGLDPARFIATGV